MPTLEYWTGSVHRRIPFAGKDELLAYANRIREAGGANALEALLPSMPWCESQCLIARALNFGCMVSPLDNSTYGDGSYQWIMVTPDAETTRRLAKAIGARTRWVDDSYRYRPIKGRKPDPERDRLVMLLPKRIGNAADAFDRDHPEFAEYVGGVDF